MGRDRVGKRVRVAHVAGRVVGMRDATTCAGRLRRAGPIGPGVESSEGKKVVLDAVLMARAETVKRARYESQQNANCECAMDLLQCYPSVSSVCSWLLLLTPKKMHILFC